MPAPHQDAARARTPTGRTRRTRTGTRAAIRASCRARSVWTLTPLACKSSVAGRARSASTSTAYPAATSASALRLTRGRNRRRSERGCRLDFMRAASCRGPTHPVLRDPRTVSQSLDVADGGLAIPRHVDDGGGRGRTMDDARGSQRRLESRRRRSGGPDRVPRASSFEADAHAACRNQRTTCAAGAEPRSGDFSCLDETDVEVAPEPFGPVAAVVPEHRQHAAERSGVARSARRSARPLLARTGRAAAG